MSDDVVITFDSPADVWRVKRGELAIAISLSEMSDEYYRWRREHPLLSGVEGAWRAHAEAFCLKRLELATMGSMNDRTTDLDEERRLDYLGPITARRCPQCDQPSVGMIVNLRKAQTSEVCANGHRWHL